MEFDRYEEVPANIAEKIIEESKTEKQTIINYPALPRHKIFSKGGVFIVKQQGSREPTRCEASWKGGALIYKINILHNG